MSGTSQHRQVSVNGERLQKVLASGGFGSRRGIEAQIKAGKISVNGKIASLGARVTPQDTIRIEGVMVPRARLAPAQHRLIAYHKPVGEICTRNDEEGRATVFDSLPKLSNARFISIGRLDINSCGLLLFTTDGELAHRLMHPSTGVDREYAVRIRGTLDNIAMAQLKAGVTLDDGEDAHFESIVYKGGEGVNRWYHVVLREGRKREVRRLFEALGFTVSRLIRVRFGQIELGRSLRPGKWRDLTKAELNGLLALAFGADGFKRAAEYAISTLRPRGRGNPGAGRGQKSRAKPRVKPQAQPRAKPQAQPRAKPQAQPRAKPQAQPQAQPRAQPRAKPPAKRQLRLRSPATRHPKP